jgi:hypothetical protein
VCGLVTHQLVVSVDAQTFEMFVLDGSLELNKYISRHIHVNGGGFMPISYVQAKGTQIGDLSRARSGSKTLCR